MNVIENIQRIRGEKRISQAEMAEKLGIAQNNYGKIERGITELTVERLYKIAEILGSSPSELLGLENLKLEESKENKKIEDLEKRIEELDDRIKDKESIISHKESILGRYTNFIEELIEYFTHNKAKEYGLMTYGNVVYEGVHYRILKRKLKNPIITSEQNRRQYQEYLHIDDLEETIELVYEDNKYLALLLSNLAIIIGSNTEIGQCWIRITNSKLSADYQSQRKYSDINYSSINDIIYSSKNDVTLFSILYSAFDKSTKKP